MNQLHVLTHRDDTDSVHVLGTFSSPSKVAVAIAEHRKAHKTDDAHGAVMSAKTDDKDVSITRYSVTEAGEDDPIHWYQSTIVQLDESVEHEI